MLEKNRARKACLRAALCPGDPAMWGGQRTSCTLGFGICKGRTGALPLALWKAEVTTLFPQTSPLTLVTVTLGGSWCSQ